MDTKLFESRPLSSTPRSINSNRRAAIFHLIAPPFFSNSFPPPFRPGGTFSFCVTSFNFRNRTRKLLGGTCSSQLGVGTARCDPKLFLPALCEDKLLLAGFLVTRREKLLSVRDKLWRLVSFGASLPSQKQFCSLTITAKRFQGSSSL